MRTRASAGGGRVRPEDLELLTELSKVGQERLEVGYSLTNRATEPIVLLNFVCLSTEEGFRNVNRVFVETDGSGVITLGQRALAEKNPGSKSAHLHSTVPVEPGQTIQSQFALALPLIDTANSGGAIPHPPRLVRLCLGWVSASAFEPAVFKRMREGKPELRSLSLSLPRFQQLLCSPVQDLG
jgi:hypothetical protein